MNFKRKTQPSPTQPCRLGPLSPALRERVPSVARRVRVPRCALLMTILIIVATLVATRAYADAQTVQIGWLSRAVKRTLPLSYLDQPPQDEGIEGARLGIADNDTTGHFTGQSFSLTEVVVPEDGDVSDGLRELATKGIRLIATDLAAPQLLSVADMPEAGSATFFNTDAEDDRLRGADCRAN